MLDHYIPTGQSSSFILLIFTNFWNFWNFFVLCSLIVLIRGNSIDYSIIPSIPFDKGHHAVENFWYFVCPEVKGQEYIVLLHAVDKMEADLLKATAGVAFKPPFGAVSGNCMVLSEKEKGSH
jgi:hypothetical protein